MCSNCTSITSLLKEAYRYIKELAERVGALESERSQQSPEIPYANMTSVAHQQPPGYSSNFIGTPVELAYNSRKRTYSNAEGLQQSPFLQGRGYDASVRSLMSGISTPWAQGASMSRSADANQHGGSQKSQHLNIKNSSDQIYTSRSALSRTAVTLEDRRVADNAEPIMHPGDSENEDSIKL